MASIRKRSENSYQITVSFGYVDGQKLLKTKTVNTDPGLSEKQRMKLINREAILFEEGVKKGQYIDSGKLSFKEFLERWLQEHCKPHLADRTFVCYEKMIYDRIIPALGHMKLNVIKPLHLQEFYNNLNEPGMRLDNRYISKQKLVSSVNKMKLTKIELAKMIGTTTSTLRNILEGNATNLQTAQKISTALNEKLDSLFKQKTNDKILSGSSIKKYHAVLSSALQDAVQWQMIESNPAGRIKPPRASKKEMPFLDPDQALSVLSALEKEPIKYQTLIALDAFTGLRRGEMLGLQWSCINLENAVLAVKQSLQYIPGKGLSLKSPKNKTSNRLISLTPYMVSLLKKYRVWHNEIRLMYGDMWNDNDFVFTQERNPGEPMHPDTVSSWFPAFMKRHDLPPINFHALRHTVTTLLINRGMDIKSVSGIMGHSSANTTLNIYAHLMQTANKQAADIMQGILSPEKKSFKSG